MAKQGVKIIKATLDLQAKAGVGDVPLERVIRAERVIERDMTDFATLADKFLNDLHDAILKARGAAGDSDTLMAGLVKPVMELKANGPMFKYELVGSLANVMLGFLEHVMELDSDIIQIVEAHHTTINLIIRKRMKGDGGASGPILKSELEAACARYFTKNPKNFKSAKAKA
ncbi:MAG: hypothetical protein AAB276_04500 [Pseudomonadota bacterium]